MKWMTWPIWLGCAWLFGCAHAPDALVPASDPQAAVRVGVAGAGATLLESYSQSVDPFVRGMAVATRARLAVEASGGVAATAGLWDPDPYVQARTVDVLLQRLDEAPSRTQLLTLIQRPEVDAYIACGAALRLPQPWSPELQQGVRARLRGPLWKQAPCAGVAATWGEPDAAARLVAAVETGALALEASFLVDLSPYDIPGLTPAMADALGTAEDLLQPTLARALLARGHDAGLAHFRAALGDPDPMVRFEAVVLLELGPPDIAEPLLAKASGQGGPEATVAALILTARSADPDFKAIEAAATSDDRDVRWAAIRLLGMAAAPPSSGTALRGAKRVERVLAAAVVDPEPVIQREAWVQVAKLGISALSAVADAAVNNEELDPMVRIAAVEAQARLRSRDLAAAP